MATAFVAHYGHAQGLTITLTPSNYNGYHISCFGFKDGSIDAEVSGGMEPYTFEWSNGANEEDVSGLASGFYRLRAIDGLGAEGEAELTLVEPEALRVSAIPFKYPSSHNISCYECFNGSIDITVTSGVAPYGYDWGDEVFTEDRSGLGAMPYAVTVTDANGCTLKSETIHLTQPERSDWTMGGNANTNPALHYLGTTDAKDAVFRTNGQERLRIFSDGAVRVAGLTGATYGGLLTVDPAGTLKRLAGPNDPAPAGSGYCPSADRGPMPWYLCGNHIAEDEFLGTINPRSLIIKTDNLQRMLISPDGKVAIGTPYPLHQLDVQHADASGGMSLRNALPGNAHSEIRFYQGATQRWGLGCDLNSNGGQDFFLWDQVAQVPRLFVNEQGKVGIGTMPPANNSSLYKLYVGGGIAARDVRVTQASTWPDYVFAPDYSLLPLAALRRYVQENRHLPGIPSEQELKAEGGYEVGDMQARLLKLVEEQTLYILELEERLNRLEAAQPKPAKP